VGEAGGGPEMSVSERRAALLGALFSAAAEALAPVL
jgi:hypothetical protein